ncbi:MAG: response regulator, partial [Candidatus Binatia bacterium]
MASAESRKLTTLECPGQILLVEDDGEVREALSAQLQSEGYGVVEAKSGNEALELVQRTPFDVVLTDVQMPGLNGIELLKHIAPLQ